MNRLIMYTLMGLCIFYAGINLVFAERTYVAWKDLTLHTKEVVVSFENSGSQIWTGYSLAAKVYDLENKVISSSFSKMKKSLKPSEHEIIKLSLNKELTQGTNYRVEVFLHRSAGNILSKTWVDKLAFDLNPRSRTASALNGFSEVEDMKNPIKKQVKKDLSIL